MLASVLLVVLAACALALPIWPLDPALTEVVAVPFAGAVFLIICAVEARHQWLRDRAFLSFRSTVDRLRLPGVLLGVRGVCKIYKPQ
jgi:hypothetical protein